MNDKGFYDHFVTGNNTSTLHCYQIHKKGKARNDHKVKTGCFWSNRLHNPFTQNLGLEAHFEISDEESDTKYYNTTKINIKEGGKYGNGKVVNTDVENVDFPGYDSPKGFLSYIDEEDVIP